MKDLFTWFWTAMIFLSVAWYTIMLLYVGPKGGREIWQMTRSLADRREEE